MQVWLVSTMIRVSIDVPPPSAVGCRVGVDDFVVDWISDEGQTLNFASIVRYERAGNFDGSDGRMSFATRL
jgi:hypothetical protein